MKINDFIDFRPKKAKSRNCGFSGIPGGAFSAPGAPNVPKTVLPPQLYFSSPKIDKILHIYLQKPKKLRKPFRGPRSSFGGRAGCTSSTVFNNSPSRDREFTSFFSSFCPRPDLAVFSGFRSSKNSCFWWYFESKVFPSQERIWWKWWKLVDIVGWYVRIAVPYNSPTILQKLRCKMSITIQNDFDIVALQLIYRRNNFLCSVRKLLNDFTPQRPII